jgi:hypothetical protein
MPRIGRAKCQPDQDERERMLAVLTEVGVRPEPRRSQRRERDGGSQKPGNYSKDGCHQDGISRFTDRTSPHVKLNASVVNRTLRQDHKACRTPRPSMKRSLICTGSLRVAPTPGLSSMRAAINVGREADSD